MLLSTRVTLIAVLTFHLACLQLAGGVVKLFRDDAFVTIPEGRLKGFRRDGVFHFIGIRYGQAPLGYHRFKAALPETPWYGVRDATQYGSYCPNVQLLTGIVMGSEDCLFLNVFFKHSPEFGKLPVMVWLHGGAFRNGAGHFPGTGPEFLVQEGVLLVTLNYRVGAFGFLCMGDGAPGNAGIHDQILALKWIQRNIAYFGGDPTRVTLFGFSAGSISSEILMLSPAARGLFHHIIAQSGSVLSPWAMVNNPKLQALRLAVELGYRGHVSGVIPFLKQTSWRKIARASRMLTAPAAERNVLDIYFTPCIEEKYPYMDYQPILTQHPMGIMARGEYRKIPYMTGITSDEAILMLRNQRVDTKVWPKLQNSSTFFIPSDLHLKGFSFYDVKSLARKIGTFYLGNATTDETFIDGLVRYGTDVWFLLGLIHGVNFMLQNGNNQVYVYRFAFNGDFNFYKRFTNYQGLGTSHGDEMGYLFSAPYPANYIQKHQRYNRENFMKHRMVRMWTNFAKTGNPNYGDSYDTKSSIFWPAIHTSQDKCYLDINDQLTVVQGLPYEGRIRFWEEIYRKYG